MFYKKTRFQNYVKQQQQNFHAQVWNKINRPATGLSSVYPYFHPVVGSNDNKLYKSKIMSVLLAALAK